MMVKLSRRNIVNSSIYNNEQMKRYQKAALQKKNKNPVTIELSDADYEAAKSFGASYRSVLSDILAIAIKDPNLVNRVRIR